MRNEDRQTLKLDLSIKLLMSCLLKETVILPSNSVEVYEAHGKEVNHQAAMTFKEFFQFLYTAFLNASNHQAPSVHKTAKFFL